MILDFFHNNSHERLPLLEYSEIKFTLAFVDDFVATKSAGNTVVRTTRAGDKAIRTTRPDGSVIDISPKRVNEFVPNTHPKAPPGALNRVKFDNAIPGSKGFKRPPTQQELGILKNAE